MPSICFYFQVHQPYRLRHYTFFDIGVSPFYEDSDANKRIMQKVSEKSYLPMNELLLKLIKKHKGKFKVSFSISGTALDQFEAYSPEVIKSFQKLVDTGHVELLAETYDHTLAFIYSQEEFEKQVERHVSRIEELFGVRPQVFRNTELIYNNDLAASVAKMGFKGVLAEGADHVLGWRTPNFLYTPAGIPSLKLLLKNYRLSDDIAFRFSDQSWGEYPLTSEKFAGWVHSFCGTGELINLFMDYETFGEHHWEHTGIFHFMEALPDAIMANKEFDFVTPSEAIKKYSPAAELDIPDYVSWADIERDLTAWMGNDMQRDALSSVFHMKDSIYAAGSEDLVKVWRRIQTSDHFYYMSTKWFADGEVHKYFNPYGTPYDAYINFMNVLADLSLRVDNLKEKSDKGEALPVKKAAVKKTPVSKSAVKGAAVAKKAPAKKAAVKKTEKEESATKKNSTGKPAKKTTKSAGTTKKKDGAK